MLDKSLIKSGVIEEYHHCTDPDVIDAFPDSAVDLVFNTVMEYREALQNGERAAAAFETERCESLIGRIESEYGENASLIIHYLMDRLQDIRILSGANCNP